MEKELKKYEIGFLVKAEEEKQELISILNKGGFSITDNGMTSRIKLAYPVKKEGFAFFGYVHFSGDPEKIKDVDKNLKSSSKILRHLIISKSFIGKEMNEETGKRTEVVENDSRAQDPSVAPVFSAFKASPKKDVLSNEDLEKKLEEILK